MNNMNSEPNTTISNNAPNTGIIIGYDQQTGSPIYQQNQDPVNQQPIPQQVYQTKKPKKKRTILIVIISLVLFFSIILSGIFFILNGGFQTKKEKVFFGMQKTFTDLADSELEEYLGFPNLSGKIKEGEYATHYSLFLDDSSLDELNEYIGSGLTSDTAYNMKEKKASNKLSIYYGDTEFLTTTLYGYDDNLSIACEDIFEGYIQCQTENFTKEYNDSYFSTFMGSEISENIDFNIFNLLQENTEEVETSGASYQEFLIECSKEIATLYDSIIVTSMDTKKVSINGKDKKCKQYEVVIPADELNDLYDSFLEFLEDQDSSSYEYLEAGEFYSEDIHFYVALNKKTMVYFELLENEINDDVFISSEFSFLGKDHAIDIVEGEIFISDETEYGDDLEITFNSEAKTSKSVTSHEIEVTLDDLTLEIESEFDNKNGDTSIKMSSEPFVIFVKGAFKDVIKGESFTYDIEDLTLSYDDSLDEFDINFSGDYSINTKDIIVETPSGTCYDLFTLTEEDIENLSTNISETVTENELLLNIFESSGINLTNRIVWDGYSNPFYLYTDYDFTSSGYYENIDNDYDFYSALYEYYDDYYALTYSISNFEGYDTFLSYIEEYVSGIEDDYGLNFDDFMYEIYYFYTEDANFTSFYDYLDYYFTTYDGLLDGMYDSIPVDGYVHSDFLESNILSNLYLDSNYYMDFYEYYNDYYSWDYYFSGFPSYDNFVAYIQYFASSNYTLRCTDDYNEVFDITDFVRELDLFFYSTYGNMDDYMESIYGDYYNW